MSRALHQLGRFAARRPRAVIGAWLAVAALVIVASAGFGRDLEDSFHVPGLDSARADALLERGFELVSGGTDNHLILVDLTSREIGGKPAAKALDRAGIELNYNTVPYDTRKPFDPSGVRIGTPAVTTRGMAPEHMAQGSAEV